MWFINIVLIYIFTEQFVNRNNTRREIGKKLWDVSDFEFFESHTKPHHD